MIITCDKLSIEQYHADPAITNSKLKDLRQRGPLYYHRKHVRKVIEQEPTRAMNAGQALEDAYFFPAMFKRRWAMKPAGMKFNTVDGKRWQATAESMGQSILPDDDRQAIEGMMKSLKENTVAQELLAAGVAQLTARYTGGKEGQPDFGLALQTRPDWFNEKGCRHSQGRPYFADLKKTADLGAWWDFMNPKDTKHARPIFQFGYHIQAGIVERCFAQEGFMDTDHFLVVVEEQEPFRSQVFRMAEDYRKIGWNEAARTLNVLQNCLRLKQWPAVPGGEGGPIELEPPNFVLEMEAQKYDAATR